MSDHEYVVQTIRQALKAVDDADVPADLRPIALAGALEMMRVVQRALPQTDEEVAVTSPNSRSTATIARAFGVSSDLIDMVYDSGDGNIDLVIHRSKLPPRKAPAMKAVATLVAGGRQAAGLEDWTPVSVIRDVCRQFGVLDLPNFSTEVASLGDVFLVRGKGQGREFKVTRHGFGGGQIGRATHWF